ncbi:hypothetical protein K439DRAFT_1240896, partial [Ramaria rubella]
PTRQPSTYIGLSNLKGSYRPTHLLPIFNYPPLLAQVSRSDPTKVFVNDINRGVTRYGTIYPEDRRFFLNETTNSIAQFRVADWGMERCVISIILPNRQAIISSNDPNNTFQINPSAGTKLNIWSLDDSSEI